MQRFSLSFLLCTFCVAVLLDTGCKFAPPAETLQRFAYTEPHMGTLFSITLYAPDKAAADAGAQAAFEKIARLDHMMTDYDPKSELMQLCLNPPDRRRHISPELFELIRESIRVRRETGGAFDITV